jgi:two-component system, chemotaxis family, CheB/CheR fusion protein
VAQLERELRETRDRLQSTIEEYETSLEEVRAGNEELVSVNEELQSTNEELETSKEELQSLNEELQTVNVELHAKIDKLDRAHGDLRNLFESTGIATVFLGRDLTIRSFTPAMSELFNLIPSDRGRALTNIAARIDYPEMRDDIEEVLRTGAPRERPVARPDKSAHYIARLLPYRSSIDELDGIIASFVDVTGILRAEAQQRMLVAELSHRVKNTLGVVVGIASATLSKGEQRDAFVERLRALSRAHDVLSRDNWGAVPLRELVRAELAPYAMDGRERYSLSGPDLVVAPRIALALGMVLHELATNAAKYGALSTEPGRVEIVGCEKSAAATVRCGPSGQPKDPSLRA